MKVLITGASGFVGSALARRLVAEGLHQIVLSSRGPLPEFSKGVELVEVPDLTVSTDWSSTLKGVDVVVHCAARVHVMNDTSSEPLADYRRVNVDGTLNLARAAAHHGVRRFIFLSTIKVNGEETLSSPFRADDEPRPTDPYAISKREAELSLLELAQKANLQVVIIRPPLVYGPGVKANFRSMLSWLHRGIPLPLGSVKNLRSLVGLDNLVDLIITCLDHPRAANQVFLVSDGKALSLPELLTLLSHAMGKKPLLIPVPVGVLRFLLSLVGKGAVVDRLTGSLEIDSGKTEQLLNWRPKFRIEDQVKKTVQSYLETATRQ